MRIPVQLQTMVVQLSRMYFTPHYEQHIPTGRIAEEMVLPSRSEGLVVGASIQHEEGTKECIGIFFNSSIWKEMIQLNDYSHASFFFNQRLVLYPTELARPRYKLSSPK